MTREEFKSKVKAYNQQLKQRNENTMKVKIKAEKEVNFVSLKVRCGTLQTGQKNTIFMNF